MAAYRIQNVLYSDQGVRRRIGIWDSTWVTATITSFECNDFEIEYDRCDKFLTPLIPSSCYYNLIDDGSAAFSTFKTALSIAQEDQFKLVVELWNGASYDIEWAGIIMTDLISWDNTPAPRPFEIVAKCGLNRLEKIYFDKINSSPYSTNAPQSIMKIVFDCLSYAGTAQFWNGSSKPYITNDATWHDTAQTAITQADIFSYIHIGKEYLVDNPEFNSDHQWISTMKSASDPPLKAKQVLNDVLQLFGVRILLSGGSWQIQQVSRQDYVSVSIGYYNYLGVYGGATAQTIRATENGSTLAVLAGGKFGYYPPVKSAKAKIYPKTIIDKYFDINGKIQGVYSGSPTLTLTSSTFDLGTIYGGADLRLQFDIHYFTYYWDAILGKDFYVQFTLKLVAGSQRIKNTVTSPWNGGDPIWTTTAADKYKNDIYFASDMTSSKERVWSTLTDSIPAGAYTGCTLVFTAELKSVSGSTNWPPYYNIWVYFKNIRVATFDTTLNNVAAITEIEKVNTLNPATTNNSIEIDYGLLRISDNYGATTISGANSILVTAPNGGSPQIPSSTWVAGYSVDEDLVSTLLKENIALQKRTTKKYDGSFRSTIYNAFKSISYDSEIWVFMGGRFSGKSDTWEGEWFGISADFTVVPSDYIKSSNLKGTDWVPGKFIPTGSPTDKYPISPIPLLKTSTKNDLGTSPASFPVGAVPNRFVRLGDRLIIINPNTQEFVQDFVVTADVEIGDTSVSVTAETLVADIWQEFQMVHEPKEVLATNILRSNYLQLQKYSEQGIGVGYNQTWQLKVNTTGAAATTMTSDGGAISGVTNIPSIPIDAAFAGIVHIVAKKQNTAECSYYIRQFLAKNDSGISTIEGTIQTIGTDIEGLVGLGIAVTIDDTADSINIDVTGIGGQNINWSAQLFGVISVYA